MSITKPDVPEAAPAPPAELVVSGPVAEEEEGLLSRSRAHVFLWAFQWATWQLREQYTTSQRSHDVSVPPVFLHLAQQAWGCCCCSLVEAIPGNVAVTVQAKCCSLGEE